METRNCRVNKNISLEQTCNICPKIKHFSKKFNAFQMSICGNLTVFFSSIPIQKPLVFSKNFQDFMKISMFFYSHCFMLKQIILDKNLNTQRKYKNRQNANPTFYILRHSLLINFLILLINKRKQAKDTSMSYNNIKNTIFSKINVLEMLDLTRNSFFKMPTFLLCSSKQSVTQVWFVFQVYFIALG